MASIYDTSGVPSTPITPTTPTSTPTTPTTTPSGGIWEGLGAAGWGALNSALFDIPEYLAKKIDPNVTYKALKDLEERNKGAYTAGEIAGIFAPTGGLVAKGVGAGLKGAKSILEALKLGKLATKAEKAAKVMDTASDIIKGTKEIPGLAGGIKQATVRGAMTGLEQAIPRAVFSDKSGDEKVSDLVSGTVLGGVAGGGLKAAGKLIGSSARQSGLLKKVGGIREPLEEALTNLELSARGLNTRDIKRAITESAKALGTNATGAAVNRADQMKKAVLDLLKKNDILNSDEAQEFIQGTGRKFEELNQKFNVDDMNMWENMFKELREHPDVKKFKMDHPEEFDKEMKDIAAKIMRAKDATSIKSMLTSEIKFANKATDRLASDKGDLAYAYKEALDDALLRLDPNYASYKADWRDLQPLRYMVARDKVSLAKPVGSGSDTAAKTSMLMGMGIGGTASAVTSGFDPTDPSTWGEAVLKTGTGLVGGALINKMAPGAANYLAGKAAGLVNRPSVMNLLDKIQDKAINAGPDIEKALEQSAAKAPAVLDLKLDGKPTEKDEKAIDKVEDSEAAISPMEQEQAKYKLSQKYAERIADNIQRAWLTKYAAQGVPYADFVRALAARTDNFEPKRSAAILFSDEQERAKYLRDYDIALKLQSMDVEKAYKNKGATKLGEFFGGANADESKMAYESLVDVLAGAMSTAGTLPSKAERAEVEKDLSTIMALPETYGPKKKLLLNKLADKYGLSLTKLQDLGLA